MIIAIAITMSVAANAQNEPTRAKHQQGDMAFGGHVSHYMESNFSLTGIGARFRYTIMEQMRVEGTFTYFFPKEIVSFGDLLSANISMLNFSVNAHYLFPVTDRITLYPLVGLGFLGVRTTGTVLGINVQNSDNFATLNIGGGVDIQVADNISINIEPKLLRTVSGDNNRDNLGGFVISAGVMFNF